MKKLATTRYENHIKRGAYTNTPEIEQLVNDIISYNESPSRQKYTIQFAFHEYCADTDRRISVSYINTNELTGKHSHDFYEINYVFEGRLLEYIDNKSFILGEGQLLFMHPSVSHSYYSFKEAKSINILIKKEYLERFCTNSGTRIRNSFLNRVVTGKSYALFSPVKGNDIMKRCIVELCRISDLENVAKNVLGIPLGNKKCPADNLIIEQHLQLLLLNIIKEIDSGGISEKAVAPNYVSSDATEIIEYFRENYRTVTVEELSKKFGYSTAQIYRIIKKHTGNNFNTNIMIIRVTRAKYLLRNTDLSISQIAQMIGLSSSEYFFRFFKTQVGFTPLQYRKLQKSGTYIHGDNNSSKLREIWNKK